MSSGFRLSPLVHLWTPVVIILGALAYHGLGRPIPVLTLVTLISGAYGKALWHDFLQRRLVQGTVQRTEAVSARDVVLGLEPTR